MAHPNEELIRRLYDARARGDAAAVRAMFAPEVRWHKPYPEPFGGELEGGRVTEVWFVAENETAAAEFFS